MKPYMKDAFCYLLRVRYAECDAQKVVFYGRYMEYIDIAVIEFMRVIWEDYGSLTAKGIDYQTVSLTMDWKAPARFDDVIAVTVRHLKTGTTSYTLKVDFYHHDSDVHIGSSTITYVMVSTGAHQKMTIPDHMRSALEKGAPGILVDHAAGTSQ